MKAIKRAVLDGIYIHDLDTLGRYFINSELQQKWNIADLEAKHIDTLHMEASRQGLHWMLQSKGKEILMRHIQGYDSLKQAKKQARKRGGKVYDKKKLKL